MEQGYIVQVSALQPHLVQGVWQVHRRIGAEVRCLKLRLHHEVSRSREQEAAYSLCHRCNLLKHTPVFKSFMLWIAETTYYARPPPTHGYPSLYQ